VALFGGEMAFLLILIPLSASAVFLVIYSYVLYQQDTQSLIKPARKHHTVIDRKNNPPRKSCIESGLFFLK